MSPQENIARGHWVFLLVCFLACIAASYGDCGEPKKLDFAILDQPFTSQVNFPVGSNVTYSCLPGYIRAPGTKNRLICLSNSTWSTPDTFCQLRSCGNPGDATNGELHIESILFGSRVNYTCNIGYRMISKKDYRECQADGTWSNEVPACEVQICMPPYPITDGSFDPVKEDYTYQDVVTYQCRDKKFALVGESSQSCTASGNWSSDAPKCVATECSNPDVANAVKLSGFTGPYYFKFSVTFGCSPGFTMKGDNSVKCNASSQWDPPLPTCNKVQLCKPPYPITDGSFYPIKEEYTYQEAVTYQCTDKNFTLIGQPSLSCTTYGNWSSDAPKCVAVECPSPDVANAIQLSGLAGPYYINVSVTFMCRPDFIMKGSNLVRCNVNSQWDPPLPTCNTVECPSPDVANAIQLSGLTGPYYINVSVAFMCRPDFIMSGSNLVRCNVNSQWDPPLPTCDKSNVAAIMGNCFILLTMILLGHVLVHHV